MVWRVGGLLRGTVATVLVLQWTAILYIVYAQRNNAIAPQAPREQQRGDAAVMALAARLLESEESLQQMLLSLETDAQGQYRILRDAVPAEPAPGVASPRSPVESIGDAAADTALSICSHASTAALPQVARLALALTGTTTTSRGDGHQQHSTPGTVPQPQLSVALFVAERSPWTALAAVTRLRACVPAFRQRVTLHFVFLARHGHYTLQGLPEGKDGGAAALHNGQLWPANESCERLLATEHLVPPGSTHAHNYALGVPYPNNLLRNVARDGAAAPWTLVLDVDMLPSRGLSLAVANAVRSLRSAGVDLTHAALVVPAFEMASGVVGGGEQLGEQWSAAGTRPGLQRLLSRGKAQPFYKDACWKCQSPTDYDRWMAISETERELYYKVPWQDPWEPFFVALDRSCPRYDERFQQYGFNRISQVCETHLAGFDFYVLTNAFVAHQGFKRADAFHSTKQEELDRNRDLYRRFKRELRVKYGSARRC